MDFFHTEMSSTRTTEKSLGVRGHRSVNATAHWFCALTWNLSRGQMVIHHTCVAAGGSSSSHTLNACTQHANGVPKGARSCLLWVPKNIRGEVLEGPQLLCMLAPHHGFLLWLSVGALGVGAARFATDPSDFLGVPRSCCACNSIWRSVLSAAAAMSSASAVSGSTGRRSLPAADWKRHLGVWRYLRRMGPS